MDRSGAVFGVQWRMRLLLARQPHGSLRGTVSFCKKWPTPLYAGDWRRRRSSCSNPASRSIF